MGWSVRILHILDDITGSLRSLVFRSEFRVVSARGLLGVNWAFDPSNAVAVSGWGFWFGAIGLLLTLAGFGFTWWQLAKTKSAAESAQAESKRVQISLRNYDAAQEVSRAKYALNETKKHFSNNAWMHGAETYEDVRMAILSVRDNMTKLDPALISEIDIASEFISKLCGRIDKQIHEDGSAVSYVKTREVMRDHGRLLGRISAAVQKEIF